MSDGTLVIVGASMAGAKAAEGLRERGFAGRIVLVGAETERPYERPPLSKGYLRGDSEREATLIHPADFYAAHEIELELGETVTAIYPRSSTATLASGRTLTFAKLLLATGAAPRRLTLPGSELAGIHYLRTLDDSSALRDRLGQGGRVAVVGAGWIGSEFAASARQRGLDVTIVDPQPLPNARIFGDEVGRFYRDVHLAQGVDLRLGTAVESFEGAGAVQRVRTSDGGAIECDLVVVGVGAIPRVDLALAAGLQVDDGVVVDAHLRTSAPNVFAAGDVARACYPFYGEHIRVEHWATALEQGTFAAGAMVGDPAEYAHIPYFFSDQYDVGMEYSGHAPVWDEVVLRGDPASGEFMAFWLRAGRVAAGMNVNVWDVNEHVQTLIRSRQTIDVRALADPGTALDTLAHDTAP